MDNKFKMTNTSLCYIEKNDKYLMMHRIKKVGDINKNKYVGIGGKFEEGETPFECAYREIKEEAGITPKNLCYRGIVTFISDLYGTEYMHLFTANDFDGEINYNCNEGNLVWINKQDVFSLPVWEGDKIFFKLLNESKEFFSLKLVYQGDKLIEHKLEISPV